MTLKIICDNSDLKALWDAQNREVLLVGGFAIGSEAYHKLWHDVRQVKDEELGHPDIPIKWNLKDLRRTLGCLGLESLYPELLRKSDRVRAMVLECLAGSGATVFLSAIRAYSGRKQVLGDRKEDLVCYSFGNLLMRLGLFKQEGLESVDAELILDWPDNNKRRPFVSEYLSGWRDGLSSSDHCTTKYHSGPLCQLGFSPSPRFSVTHLDPWLQVADLVVGAGRRFVEFACGRVDRRDFGVEQFRHLIPLLYSSGGRIIGRGIIVSPTRSGFSDRIVKALSRLESYAN